MISNRKVGGIRFVRVGRLSISFCVTKAKPQRPADEGARFSNAMVATAWLAVIVAAFGV